MDGAAIDLLGVPRRIHDWSSLDNQNWSAIGTNLKLYLVNANNVYDITPLRKAGVAFMTFATTNSSTTVQVTHDSHGLQEGDFLHFLQGNDGSPAPFNGTVGLNEPAVGGIGLYGEYRVSEVVDLTTYQFLASSAATATDSIAGSAGYEYEIPIGAASKKKAFGYGVGPYGEGTYGTPRTTSTLFESLRTWSLDNWGEDLMASPVNGAVYWWDRTKGPGVRAQRIDGAPATNRWIMVSPEDRHLICLGAHTGASPDDMLVRWSDQENFNQFRPTSTNTAGDKRLDAGSKIVTGLDTRGEKIIFTDEALYSMRFIGGRAVFGFSPLGRAGGIIGQNAAVQINGVVYFMGRDNFLVYDGVVRTLPCAVRDRVFDDINLANGDKTYGAVNRLFTEVTWFYPSAASNENDRYVAYNYQERLWHYGSMDRTAFHDQSAMFDLPYGTDASGKLYRHEDGVNANGAALPAFIESHDAEIGEGGQMMHVSRLIPDFQRLVGSVEVSLVSRRYPQTNSEVVKGPYACDESTGKISVRVRNRAVALRVASNAVDDDWRMGVWRAEVREHGRR